jgi:hypothetical protein
MEKGGGREEEKCFSFFFWSVEDLEARALAVPIVAGARSQEPSS